MHIPIIYYHSVAPRQNKSWFRYWLTLKLEFFETHLKFFKSNGFRSLFLDEYFELRKTKNYNGKYIVLTFDDGYVDNYIYVYPLLKKYGFKGTIFINPDFVDKKSTIRKTLENYWNNDATLNEIDKWGFLSWDEMSIMQNSGIIDIQSHSMSHTKYFVSDKIVNFHHPGADCLYPISNLYPERRPYYITDSNFEKLIPYGTPFFEEKSSVIAKKVIINQIFINEIIIILKKINWISHYNFNKIFKIIKPIYEEYKKNGNIINSIESEKEYLKRVYCELKKSKEEIERKIGKEVNYLCWPHGDNNEITHKIALNLGYKATTLGKMPIEYLDDTRFERFGISQVRNSLILTKLKTKYKIKSYMHEQPYLVIKTIYNFFKGKK